MTENIFDYHRFAPEEDGSNDRSAGFNRVGDVRANSGSMMVGTGPAQTGSGAQSVGNITQYASGEIVNQGGPQSTFIINRVVETVRRRIHRRDLSRDTLDWLNDRFVRPGGFDEALVTLNRYHVVLLMGDAHSGRRSSAIALLSRVAPASTPSYFRDLELDADDNEGNLFGDVELADAERLRLDLIDGDDRLLGRRVNEIDALRTRLRERDAYLVVLLSTDVGLAVPGELRPLVARITRPDPEDVLTAHLTADGLPLDHCVFPLNRTLAKRFGAVSLDRVAQFADDVRRAVKVNPALPLDEALSRCWDLKENRESEVRAAIREQEPQQKALMLSVAMLEGSNADVISAADARLFEQKTPAQTEDHWIASSGLGVRLANIGAVQDEQRCVRFKEAEYGLSVLTVFWDDYPESRNSIRDWVEDIPRLGVRLPDDNSAQVAIRVAEQSLRTDRHDHLTRLVGRWTVPGATSACMAAAFAALTLGVSDPAHGWRIREITYRWSRRPELPKPLAQTLLTVCLEVLKVDRPLAAMRRMHNLSIHPAPDIAETAADGLVDWAANDPRVRRELIMRSVSPPGWWRSSPRDARLFLRIAHLTLPDLGRGDTALDMTVRDGFQAVLNTDPTELAIRLNPWLDAAAGSTEDDAPEALELLEQMIDSCRTRLDLLSRFDWHLATWPDEPNAPSAQERAELRRELTSRMECHLIIPAPIPAR